MRTSRPQIRLAAAALAAAALFAACGEKDEPDVASLPPVPELPTTTTAPEPPEHREQGRGGGRDRPREGAGNPSAEDEAIRTVEAYLGWIDNRQGRQLCTLLTEEVIARLKLPVRRGGCAVSLSASIGYSDPRGLPVFRGVDLRHARARVDGREARVVATVSTRFADRNQASIEDDVVYLRLVAGDWRVAKPSATLYRAIGREPPPAAITPP
jgi:hypothetical protein